MTWHTVLETKPFTARAKGRLTEAEVSDLITMLARDPTVGDVIPGTGGVRKVRIGMQGRGKRGGARVIYYLYDDTMPVFLLSVYAKNEQDDITMANRNEMPKIIKALLATYRRGRRQ